MDVGFIGLGAMGKPMASNIIKAEHRLRVWNRSPGPMEELEGQGAETADSPAGVFDADVVVTMLSDDAAVNAVILESDALSQARPGMVHVVSATISVAMAKCLADAHDRAKVRYISAPVLGRPDLAAAAGLNVLAAGDADAIEQARPVLDAIGKQVWTVGDQPYMANVIKLAVNFQLAAAIEAMAEATALVKRHGANPKDLLDVLTGTLFAAPAYKTYGPMVVEQRFQPALFKLPLGLKDIREVLAAGESVGAPLPLASLLRDNFVDAIGHGDADKDWSAVAAVALRRAGLQG